MLVPHASAVCHLSPFHSPLSRCICLAQCRDLREPFYLPRHSPSRPCLIDNVGCPYCRRICPLFYRRPTVLSMPPATTPTTTPTTYPLIQTKTTSPSQARKYTSINLYINTHSAVLVIFSLVSRLYLSLCLIRPSSSTKSAGGTHGSRHRGYSLYPRAQSGMA